MTSFSHGRGRVLTAKEIANRHRIVSGAVGTWCEPRPKPRNPGSDPGPEPAMSGGEPLPKPLAPAGELVTP